MVTLSKDQINTLISDILIYVNNRINKALANRPEIFTLTQDEYKALVESDELDDTAVYLIKEEDTAAAVSTLSIDPESETDPESESEND